MPSWYEEKIAELHGLIEDEHAKCVRAREEAAELRAIPTVHVMVSSTTAARAEDVKDSLHVMGAPEDVKLLTDTLSTLRAENGDLRGALDAIDHHTYGWTLASVSTVIDRIRLTARAALDKQVP